MRPPDREGRAASWLGLDRFRALTLLVVALAIVIRLAVVVADDDYTPAHDAFDYHRHALSIAAGDGYPSSGYAVEGGPSALRAPGYPYALGATYAALGVEEDGGRVLNVALGGLAVLLVIALGTRIGGRRVGLIAGLLAAVFPPLVLVSRDLYSENLFIPLALAVPLAALRFRDDQRLRWLAAVGVLCGLAALTRNPGPALLIPALVGVWALRPRFSLRALTAPASVILIAALTVLPWTLRNAVEFGRFIPVTTSTGFALAGTYNETSGQDPRFRTSWRTPVDVPEYEPLFRTPGVDEGTLDATLRREATQFARDNPGYVVEVTWNNGLRLFHLQGASVVEPGAAVEMRGIGSGATTAERIALAVIAPLTLAGIVLLVQRHRRLRAESPPGTEAQALRATAFVWLIPALLLLSAALVAGLPRYRLPADPFLLILAALGVNWVIALFSTPRTAGVEPSTPPPTHARGKATVAAALIAAIAVAGCGSSGPVEEEPPPAAEPAEISKPRYIARADALCAKSLAKTRRIVDDALSGSADTALELTTEGLVRPGLEIRRELADRLAQLPAPPADPNLDTFIKLFPATEALIRQRLEAGERGNADRAAEIELLLGELGGEQRAAAAAYGLDDCSADFGSLQT